MKKLFLLPALFLLFFITALGQTTDLVKSEGITNPLHQANIGKIIFMETYIPIEQYKETDFLKSFQIKEPCDLSMRVYLANSLTNYLHALAPELNAEELAKKGNYQFSFFIDDKLVYVENLNAGAGSAENKNAKTVLRAPLLSKSNEDHWGRFLWNRFLLKVGQDALSAGAHQMKIQIKPYVQMADIKVGEVIAEGQIELIIPEKVASEKQIAIQKIKKNSDWSISTDTYDTAKIKALKKKIVTEDYKNIRSIVVIKNGKLLIEEYFNKAKRNTLHDTRSVGKTFAAALSGIAIDKGYLKNENQTLSEFYTLKNFKHYHPKKESVTLKNLLNMSSAFDGYDFNDSSPGNEENMYPTENWVNFTLDLPMDSTKVNGAQWAYFTAGVVVIGDVLNKVVPNGLEKFADKTLFQPLGIKKYQWQYTPQKVANTAGGIQLRALDLAKFGQLYQNKGLWNGQRIMSEAWVQKSLSHQLKLPERENEFYGYLLWNKTYTVNNKNYEVYNASGNGGNKIFIFKNQPLVIIITSTAYNTPYGHAQVDKMMQKYLIPAVLE
jgi:CubicO group peptidase (beta-lactamase class C family)